MAETDNIALMASAVAKDIFGVFGWKQQGPVNQNWACVDKVHDRRTHPSDVVFQYEEPYTDQRIYVNCDLKSYAKGSISTAALGGALRSLAMAVECANRSEEWQKLYVDSDHPFEAVGLLFLYNHDGEYDGDFDRLSDSMDEKSIDLAFGRRMYLLGPRRIAYLHTVATNIKGLRADNQLPGPGDCGFYYPDLISKRPRRTTLAAASVESLCSPWQILRFHKPGGTTSEERYIVYYDGELADVDECKYLIDYFFRYQLVRDDSRIEIRAPFACSQAAALMQKARDAYFETFYSLPEFRVRLDRIGFEHVTTITSRFSQVALGMR